MTVRLVRLKVHLVLLSLLTFGLSQAQQNDSIHSHEQKEFKKNAVQLEIMGKSVFVGLAYDRIIYHKAFDIHANIGFSPLFYGLDFPNQQVINGSLYASTNKFIFDLVAGTSFTYWYRHRSRYDVGTFEITGTSIFIGTDVSIGKRWSMQLLYTPMFITEKSINYDQPDADTFVERSRHSGSGYFWLWGGLNTRYKF